MFCNMKAIPDSETDLHKFWVFNSCRITELPTPAKKDLPGFPGKVSVAAELVISIQG